VAISPSALSKIFTLREHRSRQISFWALFRAAMIAANRAESAAIS
jgi:hypothetical protein